MTIINKYLERNSSFCNLVLKFIHISFIYHLYIIYKQKLQLLMWLILYEKKQIIELIRSVIGQTKLTVVDPEADDWLREHPIPLFNGLPAQLVTRYTTADIEDLVRNTQSVSEPNRSGL